MAAETARTSLVAMGAGQLGKRGASFDCSDVGEEFDSKALNHKLVVTEVVESGIHAQEVSVPNNLFVTIVRSLSWFF